MTGRLGVLNAAQALDTSNVRRLLEVCKDDKIVTIIFEDECTPEGLVGICEEMETYGPVALLVWQITDTEVILENIFVFELDDIYPENIGEKTAVTLKVLQAKLKNRGCFAVIGLARNISSQANTNC